MCRRMVGWLAIAAAAGIAATAVAQAGAAGQKPTDAYGYGLYGIVVLVSAFGGSIRHARSYLKHPDLPNQWVRLFVEIGTAIMLGMITFLSCQSRDMDLILTNLFVFVTAATGNVAIGLMRGALNKLDADNKS